MAITARDLTKVYRTGSKEVRAVDGVTLAIADRTSCAIVGPSGAGKSTLLHLLGGLDRPTSGSITIDGDELAAMSDAVRARKRNGSIGLVFQFYHLLPEFTALENVMLPGIMRHPKSGGKRGETRKRAGDLMRIVGLAERLDHRPAELSGGEAQRVAIARALMNEPKILLCDEPTGNLDSRTSASIYDLLFDLPSRSGITLVIVTHDTSIISRATATIRMQDGKIV